MNFSENNIDRLLMARARIDEELRQFKSEISILFTDVVGSTDYFDRYGDTAGIGMLHRHVDLGKKAMDGFHGRVIKTIGDSVMAEFPDPCSAVQAAVELQRRLLAHNLTLPERERLQLRVGINHGPAIRSGDDVYGDAVNVAARIVKHTGPAQILVSHTVRGAVAPESGIQFSCLGKISMKGKAAHAEVYEVVWTEAVTYARLQSDLTAAVARGELISPGMSPDDLARSPLISPDPDRLLPEPPPAIVGEGSNESSPRSTEARSTDAFDTPQTVGMTIGRYRLLHKIGEGGMGEVWLAEQKEPVRRRVALKLVKAGMSTRDVIARFESERQALALMDHPAIARVFDAGSTPAGAPYFAMEYVAGVPITTWCDNHRLTTRERLELFIHVCEGVQHAHQKAIIHRDLKPSNILVTEVDGHAAPKIIDFGVAKALAQKLTADTLFTRVGVLIGTPEYMSPEQASSSGEDIDTRTDVYSLGIVLYELLAGAPPLDLRNIAFEEFLRRLRVEEPPKPSTKIRTQDPARSTEVAHSRQAEPRALAKQMRGDLDSIALKALEKERSRR